MLWRFLILLLISASPTHAAPTVNAKDHGAMGDGTTDDTAALQQAVDAAAETKGTLHVPSGIYLIDASRGVVLKSQMTLELEEGAVLRAIPNALESYRIVSISKCEAVTVTGGTIEGERDAHQGKTGEWGNGIDVRDSKQIVIDKVTVKSCWGDGIYVGQRSENVTISRVTCDENRRQGLSITSAAEVTVRDSTFRHTHGTAPECGVDIEPNAGETVANCQVLKCQFEANAGGGLQVGPANADKEKSSVTEFVAAGNSFTGNGTSQPPRYTIQISNCTGATVRDNQLNGNSGIGIGVLSSKNTTLTGNEVRQTRLTSNRSDSGILLTTDQGTTCTDNIVSQNEGYGIFLWKSSTDVSQNRVTGNKRGQVKR